MLDDRVYMNGVLSHNRRIGDIGQNRAVKGVTCQSKSSLSMGRRTIHSTQYAQLARCGGGGRDSELLREG